MNFIGLNDLREQFLAFFESKQHLRATSASLVPPADDASLLLINSGMAPLKKYFTGEVMPPNSRMASCQKCVRTPDIESVGIKDRYGTYFEMLGNFSFGDYFKREAIVWAWEFMTQVLKIDPKLLYCSVFEDDDEAFEIWTKEIGVPVSNMVRMGREDNFWEHGKGPCGPCSEIYVDRGIQYGCASADCQVGCDCDRYVEVWNLVFTQFNSDGEGNYTELETKNIDTGMGLERMACVMQGVGNLFEVDTMQAIMQHVSRISGITYKENAKHDISLRIITDHVRSTTMMIGDGVLPSNEGRGYVLRRLLRRAARHGRLLGVEDAFLSEIAKTVIQENAKAYPNLAEKQEYILRVIAQEEESFGRTIDAGLGLLEKMLENCKGELPGEDAFKLSDTFGFPIDLTKEIAAEHNIIIDEAGYAELVKQQRERSRAGRKEAGGWDSEGAGQKPEAQYDPIQHTAAHLLQAALREVLGNHVEQAGQALTATSLRFDFTHFSALTSKELKQVEARVNEVITQALPVQIEEMPIDQARAAGAIALFGEKYGDIVRVVSAGNSKELCSGNHAQNTRDLGLFIITKESSISSGVRRIEATAREPYAAFIETRNALSTRITELEAQNKAQVKELEKALAAAHEKLSGFAVQELMQIAVEIAGVKFICGELGGDLRKACDKAKQSDENVVALFAQKSERGIQFAAACSPGAVKAGAHAGNLVRAVAQAAGGSGGGKPDSAMAGGKDPAKLAGALAIAEETLKAMILN